MKQKYIDNYKFLKSLPIVQELINKNKLLKKENKNLRNAISLLSEMKCKNVCNSKQDHDVISIYSDDSEENITYSVENIGEKRTIYTDDGETRILENCKPVNSNKNSFCNTFIKKEKVSNEEDETNKCDECNIKLDRYRDGSTDENVRCNNCYWEDKEGNP